MYKVVDLFAGAGGLSLGFEQTHEFKIVAAFEKNPDMQATYRYNHPNAVVYGDVCSVDFSKLNEDFGGIDVVIGGPPCQGFSNANRQKNYAINQNNMLVKQYIRAITELRPKAFVMENVSMLRSDVHRFYMETTDEELVRKYNIQTKESKLILLESKYTFQGALDIIKDANKITEHLWQKKDYDEINVIYKAAKNPVKFIGALKKHKTRLVKIADKYVKYEGNSYIELASKNAFSALIEYYRGCVAAEQLKDVIEPAIMIQRMLSKAAEIHNNSILVDRYDNNNGVTAIIRSFAVYDYLTKILSSDEYGYIIRDGVICAADYGAPQKRMRFVAMGILKSISDNVQLPPGNYDVKHYRTVQEAIEDLEDVKPVTELSEDVGIALSDKEGLGDLASTLRDSPILKNHIITKTTDIALKRFKALTQGQNFHALDKELKENTYTDASRTQNTIYLRLKYDAPCGTVVNVRKSMWIHPTLDRAISIREAARLQTFPDSFVFYGSKDMQYQQVGNAVPPIMANAIAKALLELIGEEKG